MSIGCPGSLGHKNYSLRIVFELLRRWIYGCLATAYKNLLSEGCVRNPPRPLFSDSLLADCLPSIVQADPGGCHLLAI